MVVNLSQRPQWIKLFLFLILTLGIIQSIDAFNRFPYLRVQQPHYGPHFNLVNYKKTIPSQQPTVVTSLVNFSSEEQGQKIQRRCLVLKNTLHPIKEHDTVSIDRMKKNNHRNLARKYNRKKYFIFMFYWITCALAWRGDPKLAHAISVLRSKSISPEKTLSSSTSTPYIEPSGILISGLLVTAASLVIRLLGLPHLSNRVIKSAARMAFQLLLAGSLILDFVFQRNHPMIVFSWIAMVFAIASKEASSKVKYKYDHMKRDCALSLVLGVGSVLFIALYGIFKKTDYGTIWDARSAIPMAGLLVGNSLSSISLGLNTLLTEFGENRELIELRLSRGASIQEAALPAIEKSMSVALTPKFNNMAAAGIILMPGTMTGQILGGASPITAAMYQVVIFCGISAASCFTLFSLSHLVLRRMFNYHSTSHTLLSADDSTLISKTKKTRRRKRDYLFFWKKEKTKQIKDSKDLYRNSPVKTVTLQNSTLREDALGNSNGDFKEIRSQGVSLHIDKLVVKRTNLTISCNVGQGDRIGISGPSGVGKTQLLRTIAKLDDARDGSMSIRNQHEQTYANDTEIPGSEWRSYVTWVSQDRPTLDGTPMQFYEQILSYRAQKKKNIKSSLQNVVSPDEIGKQWSLAPSIFHQKWNSLSGGEAQRANLAIALSLGPDILLLDEPTSACDEATTLAVEKTLSEMNIPIVIVSHDCRQIERFCTDQISLS